ncbi:MAG: hypothetical protein NVS4B3_01130 [Gemmatimonadaceae bacterium]
MVASAVRRIYLSTKIMSTPQRSSRPTSSRSRRVSEETASHAGRDRALKLWVILARAYAALARHAEANVAASELTIAEFGILEALYHKGPLLLGDVQRKVLVTSGGVTYLIDRLATRGLVERRDCPQDRRARYAALTPTGETLIERIFPSHGRAIERAVASLSAAEQTHATALLRTLGRAAAELPASPPSR